MKKTNVKTVSFVLAIIGTLATVVSCVIAYITLTDSRLTQNNISTSTYEPIETTENTLTPSLPTIVPSHTPTIVLLTNTPVPTPTSPFTSNDTILEVGEWWKTDNVWLKLREVKYSVPGKRLSISLDLWNQTGSSLAIRWAPKANLSLTDNTGHTYPYDIHYVNVTGDAVVENGDVITLTPPFRLFTSDFEASHYLDPDVNELYLVVTDLSRILYAKWRIPINK